MNVNIALLTVTDTRTLKTDKSGNILVDKINKANHNLVAVSYTHLTLPTSDLV